MSIRKFLASVSIASIALILWAGTAQAIAPPYLPDGWIRLHGSSAWTGQDSYGGSGTQIVSAKVRKGKSVSFDLAVQNDGSTTDSFHAHGCKSNASFKVTYWEGDSNLTKLFTAGTADSPPLDPGQHQGHLQMKIAPKDTAHKGDSISCDMTFTSDGDGVSTDTVTGMVTAR